MNGMSLDKLIKNDKKLDPDLVDVFRKLTTLAEEEKKKKYSNDKKMAEEEFCNYLKTKITRKKMKKLFEVLLLKHRYSDNKDMTELCHELRLHRPDLMRPRLLNLVLRIINVVFNKTAIIVFLIIFGLTLKVCYTDLKLIDLIEDETQRVNNIYNSAVNNIDIKIDKLTDGADLSFMEEHMSLSLKDLKQIGELNTEKELYLILTGLSKEAIIGYTSILTGGIYMTVYNILRQASYYMPRGFRLGNRVRARHSAKKILESELEKYRSYKP